MSRKRLLGNRKVNYYHMMSQIVDQRFIFGEEEKSFFQGLMRRLERFMGVHVLTYSIMSNHFHVLLEIPDCETLSDNELLSRIDEYYPSVKRKEIRKEYEFWKAYSQQAGNEKELNIWRQRYLDRMGSLSNFGKELKEQFTTWYNHRNNRRGTLWAERFRSVLVEDSHAALLTMAAYIDLNPVRAKIVKDPKAYRFCGYGEAMGGGMASISGICALAQMIRRDNRTVDWEKAQAIYRIHLFAKGDGKGIDPKRVKEVLEAKGKLSKHELLSCRVRYFRDGLAIGSKEFVERVFETHREWFSEKRKDGAREIKYSNEPFYCLRDLQKEAIRAPI
jgi:REP element-mobilizing transposase RayT